MQSSADEHSVRTQVDVLPAGENFADESSQIRVNHWFTAANGDDWCAALIKCVETLLDRQLLTDSIRVFANTTAARARQVAGVQGFEHHHQWKLFNAAKPLTGNVSGHAGCKTHRKSQDRKSVV